MATARTPQAKRSQAAKAAAKDTAPKDAPAKRRALAQRYGTVAVVDPAGPQLLVAGVRYDEEAPEVAESFLLDVRPGTATSLGDSDGVMRALCATTAGVLAVHGDGRVFLADRPLSFFDGRALCRLGDGTVLAHGDGITRIHDDGELTAIGTDQATALAAGGKTLAALCGDRVVCFRQGDGQREVLRSAGQPVAIGVDSDEHVLVLSRTDTLDIVERIGPTGRMVLLQRDIFPDGGRFAGMRFDAIAAFAGRVFLSSRVHGLYVVENGSAQALRPSLRAHTLVVDRGLLVAAGALSIGTSDDGETFLTRDLAPFIRIAEKQFPRFVA